MTKTEKTGLQEALARSEARIDQLLEAGKNGVTHQQAEQQQRELVAALIESRELRRALEDEPSRMPPPTPKAHERAGAGRH